MSQIFISAAHKSSGKTTVSLGLCRALRDAGACVQAFKKGPDYIDPMWLHRATGRACHNLDFYTMRRSEIELLVATKRLGADINVIEGNKGLYDGLDLDGSNSNAALARLLGAPVLLVIDARGMTRGIAPLILGYQAFDPEVRIAGVVLNQLGGSRHESKLRAVIEHYTDVPVIGAVGRDPGLEIVERHLGLIPSNEADEAEAKIAYIGERIGAQVNLAQVRAIAATAPGPQADADMAQAPALLPSDIRIGIARDAAFGFYYPGDLEALQAAGAELVPFDTLHDDTLPQMDGLFIGGGFPESCLDALEANESLRTQIRQAIEQGLPTYAECGGLMYLSRSIEWKGRRATMVGAIPGDIRMHERPQGRGYIRIAETEHMPWPCPPTKEGGHEIAGHEFHYSAFVALDRPARFAYRVLRGTGIDGEHDGYRYKNLLACYAHQRDTEQHHWASRFAAFVRQCKKGAVQRPDAAAPHSL